MSSEHKAALAEGRKQARIVRAYLEALESRRPGRPVTVETLEARLGRIDRRMAGEADVLRRLELSQARIDVSRQIETVQAAVNIENLEREFVTVARAYGTRKSIGYAAWRSAGVPAGVLKRAGIKQTRNRGSSA